MDPRFSVLHGSLVDLGVQPYAYGSSTIYPSQIAPSHTYQSEFERPMLNVGGHAFPSSFPLAGSSFLAADPLPRATTVYQEFPASGLGVPLAHCNVEVPALNSGYQLVGVPPYVSEMAPSGFGSAYASSHPDVSGLGRGYGSNIPSYVYQPSLQGQIHAGSSLLTSDPLGILAGRSLLLEEPDIACSRAGLLIRRMEAEQRIQLERQRVLDLKRDPAPRLNIEALNLPPVRQSSLHDKRRSENLHRDAKDAVVNRSKGARSSRIRGNTWCSICKIECSSAQVLREHIEGKKHKAQVEAQKPNTAGVKRKLEAVIKEAMKKNSELKRGGRDNATKGEVKDKRTKVENKDEAAPASETKDKAAQLTKEEKKKRKKERAERRMALLLAQRQVIQIQVVGESVDDAVSKALQETQKIGAEFDVKPDKPLVDKLGEMDTDKKIVTVQKEVGSDGVLAEGNDEAKESAGRTSSKCKEDVVIVEQTIERNANLVVMDEVATHKVSEQASPVPNSVKAEPVETRNKEFAETKNEAKVKKGKASFRTQSETVRCEVCAVTCRTAAVYETHLKGEKHAERLKKSLCVKGQPEKGKKAVAS